MKERSYHSLVIQQTPHLSYDISQSLSWQHFLHHSTYIISFPPRNVSFLITLRQKKLMDVLEDGTFHYNHLISISNSYSLHHFLSFQTLWLSPCSKPTSETHIPSSAHKKNLQYQALNKNCRKRPIWHRHHWSPSRSPGVGIVLVIWVFFLLFLEIWVLSFFPFPFSWQYWVLFYFFSKHWKPIWFFFIFYFWSEPCSFYHVLYTILSSVLSDPGGFPPWNPVWILFNIISKEIFIVVPRICRIFNILVLFCFSIFWKLKCYGPVHISFSSITLSLCFSAFHCTNFSF